MDDRRWVGVLDCWRDGMGCRDDGTGLDDRSENSKSVLLQGDWIGQVRRRGKGRVRRQGAEKQLRE